MMKKETCMKVNGRKIRRMALASKSSRMGIFMRGNGLMGLRKGRAR
jgi:hypothetical protein